MVFEHQAFWLPKDVDHPDGYQDAFAVDPAQGIAAICDGASSGLFSGRWAKLLAEQTIRQTANIEQADHFAAWLTAVRQHWQAGIDIESLAWHQKAKLATGALSTLLWIELTTDPESPGYRLRGYSIGDGCLFHVRAGRVLKAFPIETSQQFDDNPQVLGSVAHPRDATIHFDTLDEFCQADDLLVLATDAVAAWILGCLEQGHTPDFLADWNRGESAWRQTIQQLRQQHAMRYDDATLVMLKIADRETPMLETLSGQIVGWKEKLLHPRGNRWFGRNE